MQHGGDFSAAAEPLGKQYREQDGVSDSQMLSAGTPRIGAAESTLRFHSASEIAATTTDEPVFVAEPWAAEGALSEIDGKIKAAGKTTFCTSMCRTILDGSLFMGRPTRRSPSSISPSSRRPTFREALRRADLLDRDDFRVLFWHDTIGTTWPAIIFAARIEATRIGARALVVDTLGQFAGIKGDAENNAGAALEAVGPLQEAAATDGLAVMILRHERKGGGDVGTPAAVRRPSPARWTLCCASNVPKGRHGPASVCSTPSRASIRHPTRW